MATPLGRSHTRASIEPGSSGFLTLRINHYHCDVIINVDKDGAGKTSPDVLLIERLAQYKSKSQAIIYK